MLHIVHGDDTDKSRKFLQDLVKGHTITELDGKIITNSLIEDNLLSDSLFVEKRAVVVENLLSKNKKKTDIVEWLNNFKGSKLIILWEDKKLPKTTTDIFKKSEIHEFLLPQNYFQFLDSFTPGNAKQVFISFHQLLNTMSDEQVFYSLLKRLRTLLLIESNAKTEETARINAWQLGKLKQQLKAWPNNKLFKFYSELQDTEIKLKSGKLPVGLSKHLDILILSQL